MKDLTDTATVRQHFDALCDHLDIGLRARDAEWQDIVKAYGEPHRAYHTLTHIASMLRMMENMRIPQAEMPRMQAFAIYHDFFYETANIDAFALNEQRSAARFRHFAEKAKAPAAFVKNVSDLIIASKSHTWDIEADYWGALAQDIDMAILAAPCADYDAYSAGVRTEFNGFADDIFYPARLQRFILPTLETDRIFMTPRMRNHYNAMARSNLQREAAGIRLRMNRLVIP